jgi:hypothetical protein
MPRWRQRSTLRWLTGWCSSLPSGAQAARTATQENDMAKKSKRKSRIKSKAQRRKFAELLVEGKIDKDAYERWNRGAGGKDLPEHVRGKKKGKKRRKTKRRTKRHG